MTDTEEEYCGPVDPLWVKQFDSYWQQAVDRILSGAVDLMASDHGIHARRLEEADER